MYNGETPATRKTDDSRAKRNDRTPRRRAEAPLCIRPPRSRSGLPLHELENRVQANLTQIRALQEENRGFMEEIVSARAQKITEKFLDNEAS